MIKQGEEVKNGNGNGELKIDLCMVNDLVTIHKITRRDQTPRGRCIPKTRDQL